MQSKVRTCLWFNGNGEEAARFYVSLIANSAIETVMRPDPKGPPIVVEFTLAGVPYLVLNGGPMYTHTPAASIMVHTNDQAETDRLWDALIADGGREERCGWLADRFGVSWQIVPNALPQILGSSNRAGAMRAHELFMTMRKIDVAALERALNVE